MSPLFTAITNYLQENVETGSIRKLNPAIGTLGIALTVFAQPELSKLVEGCRLSSMDRREAVETYSQFWLEALLPASRKSICRSHLRLMKQLQRLGVIAAACLARISDLEYQSNPPAQGRIYKRANLSPMKHRFHVVILLCSALCAGQSTFTNSLDPDSQG